MINQNLSERVWYYTPDVPETPPKGGYKLGDVFASCLTPDQINSLHPSKFAGFSGQSIAGSDLHKLIGLETLPDLSGCFFRQVGGKALDCLTVQENQTDCSSLSFNASTWKSDGAVAHSHNTIAIASSSSKLTESNYAASKHPDNYGVIKWDSIEPMPAKTTGAVSSNQKSSSLKVIKGKLLGGVETRPQNLAMYHYIVINR